MASWYSLPAAEENDIPSPALLVYPDRIAHNIQEMIRIAGDASRLRPHVKTHKCPQIVQMQQQQGIHKFKCATIAEAEMLAQCQAHEVLIAYQLSGPHVQRLVQLKQRFPQCAFSSLVDDQVSAAQLQNVMEAAALKAQIFIDLDVGMHRTGIAPGPEAAELSRFIQSQSHLELLGWQVYDGHLRQSDFAERKRISDELFEPVTALMAETGITQVIAGGSPTFPVHALREGVELSPGTSLLWDYGYSEQLSDLKFQHAAVLLTRVISKPAGDLLCLDLGHKAVASEMPHPRVQLLDLEVVEFTTHSEEHLVVRTPEAPQYQVGDVIYGIPMHICPTCALHQELWVVKEGKVQDQWPVAARDRRLQV